MTSVVRIRFASEADEVNGFYLLATRFRVRGLPDGVYEINRPALALLDEVSVRHIVVDDDVALT